MVSHGVSWECACKIRIVLSVHQPFLYLALLCDTGGHRLDWLKNLRFVVGAVGNLLTHRSEDVPLTTVPFQQLLGVASATKAEVLEGGRVAVMWNWTEWLRLPSICTSKVPEKEASWRICSRRFISCPTCCTLFELSVRACSKCWCSGTRSRSWSEFGRSIVYSYAPMYS